MKKFSLIITTILVIIAETTFLFAKGHRPPAEAGETSQEQLIWFTEDEEIHFSIPLINGKEMISIDQLARLTNAQVHWQQVSEQVCLSRQNRSLCINWKDRTFFTGNSPGHKKIECVFQSAQLYVPVNFVETPEFEAYSQSHVTWNSKDKTFQQKNDLTLMIPPVENLGDRYRLTLVLGPETTYELLQKSTKKIWLRFLKAKTEGSQILEGDEILKSIQVNQRRSSADLTVNPGPKSTSVDVRSDSTKGTLYIDVFYSAKSIMQEGKDIRPVAVGKLSKTIKAAGSIKRRQKINVSPVSDKSVRTIVIDAGHGGIDCGAVGTRRTMEKDINLKVALEVAEQLNKEPRTRVILTREKDEFVSLQERTGVANKSKADLFVSIHCNSSLAANATGLEVYMLAASATDEAAAAVARVENSVVALEAKKGDQPSKVAQLLASLAFSDFVNESSKLAGYVCRSVKQRSSVKTTSVREANFYVLRGAQMPGVLVELDYLSNPFTELKLQSSRYRDQLAKGISEGILYYDRSVRAHAKKSDL